MIDKNVIDHYNNEIEIKTTQYNFKCELFIVFTIGFAFPSFTNNFAIS